MPLIRVKKHDFFVRRGQDVHAVVQISYPQAVLGTELEVPTVDGPVKMRIRPGTEVGQTYRLRGKGVPSLRGRVRGDQHVHVEITVPKDLTPRQKELIEQLGTEFGEDVSSKSASFIGRLKNLFD